MIGFDYGTSNCAVGIMKNGKPELLSLGEHGRFIPSTLYSPSRDIIAHWLYQQLSSAEQVLFKDQRKQALQKAQSSLRELTLDGIPAELSFGKSALKQYLEEPDEGYYIKSPKSFLGASGLLPMQIQLFEDIVAAMMCNIKQLAEQNQNKQIDHTVIGRPINFQGLKGEESNQQAITVLTNAAKRAGFKHIEFQYEPVAAGFEYEASLTKQTNVLVVDIGGGTTDCSMIQMGPDFINQTSRSKHLLAHSGVRIGGNDFDIKLALKGIMPSLGMNGVLKTGKPMPITLFNQAIAINNIHQQTEFYSASNRRLLTQIQRDAIQPQVFERLIKVHDEKLSYRLVNGAEQAKIHLTDSAVTNINLNDLDADLNTDVSRELMREASENLLSDIGKMMQEAVLQSAVKPDVIFVTGGSAKSPVLNQFISAEMPDTPVVVGDLFGSVTGGLTRWAERIFA